MVVDPDLQSVEEARHLVVKVSEARKLLAQFSKERIEVVVDAMAEAGRQPLTAVVNPQSYRAQAAPLHGVKPSLETTSRGLPRTDD